MREVITAADRTHGRWGSSSLTVGRGGSSQRERLQMDRAAPLCSTEYNTTRTRYSTIVGQTAKCYRSTYLHMGYRLMELLRAVRVSGEDIGTIAELPEGAVLSVIGEARINGLTEVEYRGMRYALFHEDLMNRSTKVSLVLAVASFR